MREKLFPLVGAKSLISVRIVGHFYFLLHVNLYLVFLSYICNLKKKLFLRSILDPKHSENFHPKNLSMYSSPTLEEGKESLVLSEPCRGSRCGREPPTSGSLPEWKVQFHSAELGGNIPGKAGRPGWVVSRGRSVTVAASLHPDLNIGGFRGVCWFCILLVV